MPDMNDDSKREETPPELANDAFQEQKKGIFDNRPWSDQALPPFDRKMVADSRAAISCGEGEPIKELIRRFGGSAAGTD